MWNLPADYRQEDKEAARKKIENDIEEFLRNGGEIKRLDPPKPNELSQNVKDDVLKRLKQQEETHMNLCRKRKAQWGLVMKKQRKTIGKFTPVHIDAFWRLRSEGWKFAAIAEMLNVSIWTLHDWHQFKTQVQANMRAAKKWGML